MKKIYFVLAAALGLASCAQEDLMVEDSHVESNGVAANSLYADFNLGSRVSIDGFNLKWGAGDDFAVLSEDMTTADKYVIDEASVGQSVGQFNLVSGQKVAAPKYAIFPNRFLLDKQSANSSKINIKLVATYNQKDRQSQNAPMFGEVNGQKVQFTKFITSLLKIDCSYLPEGYTGVKVATKDENVSLSGECVYDITNGSLTFKKVRNRVDVENVDKSQPLYVPIPANSYKTLTVYAVKPKSASQSEDKTLIIAEIFNKEYKAGFMYTINAGGVLAPKDFATDGWKKIVDSKTESAITLTDITDGTYWNKSILVDNKSISWFKTMPTFKYEKSLLGMSKVRIQYKAKNTTPSIKLGVALRSADGKFSYVQGEKSSYGTSPANTTWTAIDKGVKIQQVVETGGNTSGKTPVAATAEQLKAGFTLQFFTVDAPNEFEVGDIVMTTTYGEEIK